MGYMSDNLVQTLGSSNLMLNCLRQMQHQLNYMTINFDLNQNNFKLEAEID